MIISIKMNVFEFIDNKVYEQESEMDWSNSSFIVKLSTVILFVSLLIVMFSVFTNSSFLSIFYFVCACFAYGINVCVYNYDYSVNYSFYKENELLIDSLKRISNTPQYEIIKQKVEKFQKENNLEHVPFSFISEIKEFKDSIATLKIEDIPKNQQEKLWDKDTLKSLLEEMRKNRAHLSYDSLALLDLKDGELVQHRKEIVKQYEQMVENLDILDRIKEVSAKIGYFDELEMPELNRKFQIMVSSTGTMSSNFEENLDFIKTFKKSIDDKINDNRNTIDELVKIIPKNTNKDIILKYNKAVENNDNREIARLIPIARKNISEMINS